MKVLKDGRTFTIVEQLAREGRIEETARLMGGAEITEATRKHADEMLKLADQIKATRRS